MQHSRSSGSSQQQGVAAPTTTRPVNLEDVALLDALRQGDETAFTTLVNRYNASLYRVARMYVHNPGLAEEVVQDTWIGVLQGLGTFEPRATLKTWIFRILMYRARTIAQREGRSIPFSAAWDVQSADDEPAVDPGQFRASEADGGWVGWWLSPPGDWGSSPEEVLLRAETQTYLKEAVTGLPPSQREVLTLRDIEGMSADEVCNILGITEINQRVLLHRARSKVRQALDRYMKQER